MRLLLVEDNEELAQLLAQRLQAAGYETDVLTTAAEALAAVTTTRYAAMVLDLGLPDGDGLSVLREIRRGKDPLPVLVLTARGGLQDRVSGLRSGADDYLVKPFAFEELLARLEALLRRPGQLLGRSLQIANLAFDTESHQAFIDDKPQVLSARETAVLELLMRRKDRVVSKKLVEDHTYLGSPAMSPRMRSRSTSIASGNNCPIIAPRCKSTPFAVWDTSYPRKRRYDFIQIHLLEDHPLARGFRAIGALFDCGRQLGGAGDIVPSIPAPTPPTPLHLSFSDVMPIRGSLVRCVSVRSSTPQAPKKSIRTENRV